MNAHVDAERILDAYLAPEADRLPDRVIDAALDQIARTPQRRAVRVPWRFPDMPALSRTTGIAAVALVAVVGAGGLIYLNSGSGGAGSRSTPAPTAAPTVVPTAAPTLPPGITGWKTFTSAVYGFTISYPDDWFVFERAKDPWPAGPPDDENGFADKFTSGGPSSQDEIGLLVWQMPAPEGLYVGSDEGRLNTSFATLCDSLGYESCGVLIPPKKLCLGPLGLVETQQGCVRTLVGSIGHQGEENPHAFVVDPKTNVATVFWIAREAGFPAAERYGGVTDLLMAIVSQFNVE